MQWVVFNLFDNSRSRCIRSNNIRCPTSTISSRRYLLSFIKWWSSIGRFEPNVHVWRPSFFFNFTPSVYINIILFIYIHFVLVWIHLFTRWSYRLTHVNHPLTWGLNRIYFCTCFIVSFLVIINIQLLLIILKNAIYIIHDFSLVFNSFTHWLRAIKIKNWVIWNTSLTAIVTFI